MARARLREIRLTAFKSFDGAVLPIAPVTVLTGRNGGGKSNALDGIEVLARLAGGEELADALDGRRREGGPVRGGSRGCVPHGERSFALGCTVDLADASIDLDVRIQVDPELRIVHERLAGPAPTAKSASVERRVLMETGASSANSAAIDATIYDGTPGPTATMLYRDTRLLTAQLAAGPKPRGRARRAVIEASEAVTAALRGTFHLDPVPHLMRDYVPSRDNELRRTGVNLSAAIGRLAREDQRTFGELVGLVREVADAAVQDLVVTESEFGDVMLAVREGEAPHELTPARELSDGLLRFLAIATALLTSRRGLDIDPGPAVASGPAGNVLLVIEELENGLHPSQAARILALVQSTVRALGTQVAFTTHSPALLNALRGAVNDDVIVCYRESGHSRLRRLTAMPGYAEAMATGRLGDVVSQGGLVRPEEPETDFVEFNRLLGIE